MGGLIRQWDPYGHLASVHGHGEFPFRTSPWADFAMHQKWDEGGGYAFIRACRDKQAQSGRIMPQINEEYGYEDHYPRWGGNRKWPARTADNRRRLAWEMVMAGGYQTTGERADTGTGWGADTGGGWINGRGDNSMVMLQGYGHMVDFFTSIPWWTLNPDDALIRKADRPAATTKPTHIAYTRDKQGQAAMYLDGKLIASKAVPGELTNWDPGFRLALANELTGDRPWLGDYYGVAIWDSARTAEQAAERFRAGMRAKPADRPLVHYTFAEKGGDIVHDISEHGKPLNLKIDKPDAVRWLPGGGLRIDSPTRIASPHNGDELFVGCDVGGFYHSADGGKSYRIWNTGPEDYFVECIVPHPHDPHVIYLGCQSGVYKSTDRGHTWRLLRDGFPRKSSSRWTAPVGALAIDPKRPKVLYAGIGRPRAMTFGQGELYKSADGGEHWHRVNSSGSLPEDAWITDLVLDPRDSSHLYLACQHGLYQSSNAGETWRRTTNGMPRHHVRRVSISPSQPDVMYATLWTEPGRTTWQGGVYKSVDGGERWQPCLEGLAQHVSKPGEASQRTFNYDRLVVHPGNPDIVYVGGDGWGNSKIYKTADGGRSWNDVTNIVDRGWINFNGPSVKCLTMSPLDPDVLYFGTSMHVFETGIASKAGKRTA